jgi:hypothetical protein
LGQDINAGYAVTLDGFACGWYGRLVTRTVRNPRSANSNDLLPKALLVPDYPVPKRLKKTLRQVSINDGMHWHGLVLAIRIGTRLQEPLDVHFREHGPTYYTKELRYINVKPVTYTPEYITGYGMKSVKSSRISGDDILIFPRHISELYSKKLVRAAGERPMYDFQRG